MQCNMQYIECIELRESDEVNITICGEEPPFSNTPSLFPNNAPLLANNLPPLKNNLPLLDSKQKRKLSTKDNLLLLFTAPSDSPCDLTRERF